MEAGMRRIRRLTVTLLAILILAPLPWFSIGVLSIIGLSVREDIPLKYWVLYCGSVFLSLTVFLFMRRHYPDKIPEKLRAKKRTESAD